MAALASDEWTQEELAALAYSYKEDIEREFCQRRLANFTHQAWQVLEPKTPFAHDWYIDAICQHLEALYRGEIRNLVINMPPRHLKSMLGGVFFPAWVWALAPHLKFLYSSYSEQLSKRDSRHTRIIIQSTWYQRLWGHVFQLQDDQNQVLRFDNDHRGYRLATSVGGMGTGEGGDFVCVDDPIGIQQSFSQRELEKVVSWWDEQMSSRFNDPTTGRRLIIMQRSAVNDLTGHILTKGGYTHLCLPLEYEPSRCCYTEVPPRYWSPETVERDETGKYRWDFRSEEGESLSPSRFGRQEIENLKRDMGTQYAVAAQLQQRPTVRGGGMIQLQWFQRYDQAPHPDHFEAIVHSWDTANKGGQANAYSVGGIWGIKDNTYYLLDVVRRQVNIPELERLVADVGRTGRGWGSPNAVLIEDAASGTGIIQHLRKETTLPVIPIRPEHDKITRMDLETPTIEAGNVALPQQAPWLDAFIAEVEAFPYGPHADQADMMSQFIKWARQRGPVSETDFMPL